MANQMDDPWLIIGDVNEIMTIEGKPGRKNIGSKVALFKQLYIKQNPHI